MLVLAALASLSLARGLGFGELVGAVGAALGDALRQLLLVGVLVVLVLVAAPLLIVGVLVFAIAHLLAGCGCCDEHHGHHRCGPYFVYPFGIGPYGGHHHRGHHHHGGHHHRGHHHRGGF
ncbi:MAG: hypothetical protein JO116_24515 [Planctomycetaceae bacterium]|nr:hypothetical protein [Planctomycetaceae bacterium]